MTASAEHTPPANKARSRAITVPGIRAMKGSGEPIAMITAYDATFARLVDEAGVDMILVGDSVGMVVQGRANTLTVDLDEMEYHVKTVARAGTRAMVVGDPADPPPGALDVDPTTGIVEHVFGDDGRHHHRVVRPWAADPR